MPGCRSGRGIGPLFTRIGTKGEFTLEAMSDRSVARLVSAMPKSKGSIRT
jgi:hypothetical protein